MLRMSAFLGSILLGQILVATPYLGPTPELKPQVSSSSSKAPLPVLYLKPISPSSNSARPAATAKSSSSLSADDIIRAEVLRLVNIERAKAGLKTLTMNVLLQKAATDHARDMKTYGYLSHTGRDGKGPNDRIWATGYFPSCAGCVVTQSSAENIGEGQQTPKQIVDAWMASPLHKANILGAGFRDAGVGKSGVTWVLKFGSR